MSTPCARGSAGRQAEGPGSTVTSRLTGGSRSSHRTWRRRGGPRVHRNRLPAPPAGLRRDGRRRPPEGPDTHPRTGVRGRRVKRSSARPRGFRRLRRATSGSAASEVGRRRRSLPCVEDARVGRAWRFPVRFARSSGSRPPGHSLPLVPRGMSPLPRTPRAAARRTSTTSFSIGGANQVCLPGPEEQTGAIGLSVSGAAACSRGHEEARSCPEMCTYGQAMHAMSVITVDGQRCWQEVPCNLSTTTVPARRNKHGADPQSGPTRHR